MSSPSSMHLIFIPTQPSLRRTTGSSTLQSSSTAPSATLQNPVGANLSFTFRACGFLEFFPPNWTCNTYDPILEVSLQNSTLYTPHGQVL